MAVPQEQYWTAYLADPKPSVTRSSDFALRVWQGIPLESDLRRRVWLQCVARAKAEKKGPEEVKEEKVSKDVIEQINMELEPGHFARFNPKQEAGASPDDLDRVKRVLIAHATKQALQEYVEGSAQLVSRLLSVMKNSEDDTLAVLQLLTEKMKNFHKNNHVGLRTMVLVLAEIMCRELPELCLHFNNCHFDVVDLSDVVCVWTLPLFSCHFSQGVVKRLVDIVLLDGPDHLIGFVFGMLKVFAPSLLHQTADSIYTVVTELPESLSPQHVAQAFKIGFEVFRARAEMVAEIRAKKNWQKAVEQSGTLTFVKGVGTPVVPAPTPSSTASSTAGLTSPGSIASPDARTVSFAVGSPKTLARALDIDEKTNVTTASSGLTSSGGATATRPSVLPSPSTLTPLSATSHSTASTPAEVERLLVAADRVDPNDAKAMKRILDDMKAQLLSARHTHRAFPNGSIITDTKDGTSGSDGEDVPFARAHHQESIAMSLLGSGSVTNPSHIESKSAIVVPTATTATTAAGSSTSSTSTTVTGTSGTGAALKPPNKNAVIRYSELMEYQEFPCVYMEGYLMKSRAPSRIFKRRNSAGFFGNLHRRFFVLQGHFLTYFKSHQQKKPTKDVSVDMRGRRVTILKNHEFGPFAFQVDSVKDNGPLYLLFASNAAVRDAWVRVLAAASGLPAEPAPTAT